LSPLKNLEESAKKAYEAIFNDQKIVEIEEKRYEVRHTSKRSIRFVAVDDYTFLNQNPEKNSVWGRLARDGHKIMWVIEDGDYVGQVRDGVYHDFHSEN
jgi:hypothetical protein